MMRPALAACVAAWLLVAGCDATSVHAQTAPAPDAGTPDTGTTDTGTPAPPIIPVLPAAPAFQPPVASPDTAPPVVQTPSSAPAVQTPSPQSPATAPPATTQAVPAAPAPAPPADPAAPATAAWQSRPVVELQALDKVTAQTTKLSGRIGETLSFGTLSIRLAQCLAAPPDQRQDATAFLDITDKTGVAGFRGWMFAAEPGVAMLEHPLYDIRLTACHA